MTNYGTAGNGGTNNNGYSVRTGAEGDAILTIATETMERMMRAGDPFTALDVSNALKARHFPVRHHEVSAVARGLWAGGGMASFGYDRELIAVTATGGDAAQAYLYRHATQTAGDYTKDAKDAQPALPPVPADEARALDDITPGGVPLSPLAQTARAGMVGAAVTSGQACANRASRARGTRGAFRRDGALAVPRPLIEAAGFAEGDTLVLTHDAATDHFVLSIAATGGAMGVLVRVWGDLRVRIARTKLAVAGVALLASNPASLAKPAKPAFDNNGAQVRFKP